MSCQELVELVTEYLEGVLPSHERARFEAHVAECGACARYVEQMRATIGVVGATGGAAPPPELLELFRDFRRRL